MREHVLTVIDAHWPHALIGAVRDEIDRWYVVATPRPDAVDNAQKLAAELGAKGSVLLNQKGGMVDSIALSGIDRAVELPVVKEPDRWEGNLGKKVLMHAYGEGTWGAYEPVSFFSGLRRRFSRSK
jgi:hypothetical protein